MKTVRGIGCLVLACAANQGYREFKTSDGYQDDLLGVVCIPLGAVQADADARDDSQLRADVG